MVYDINIASYAVGNTHFVSSDTPLHVITSQENAAEKSFQWFTNHHIKANHDKCYLLTLKSFPLRRKILWKNSSDNEKLLGDTIDAKLNFNRHLKNVFEKANKKVQVIARITHYMSISKRKLLMNSVTMNNNINWLHEMCPYIVYCDKITSFENFPEKKNESLTVRTGNLQTLVAEMFKILLATITADIPMFDKIIIIWDIFYFAISNLKSQI